MTLLLKDSRCDTKIFGSSQHGTRSAVCLNSDFRSKVDELALLWDITLLVVEWKRNLVAHGDAREEK